MPTSSKKLIPFEITTDNHELSSNKPVNDSKRADETHIRELQDRYG